MLVRRYRDGDAPSVYEVFLQAVHEGAARHYSAAQRSAWAPLGEMPAGYPARLERMNTFVAEDTRGIAGVMAATPEGYLDLAFVRPNWMGRGMAQALYSPIIEDAQDRQITRMTTHASHLAKPFFLKNGWKVDGAETVLRQGVGLDRFAMSLTLDR